MRLETLLERTAEPLRFPDAAPALLWWAEMHQRKESPRSAGTEPRSPMAPEVRELREATYAAITGCLVLKSPDDLPLDPEVTPARVEHLLTWYSSDKKVAPHGMTWAEFCDYCRATRNVLRRRLKARGLLTGKT